MSHHQSHYFHKPENALRRAQELQSISPAGDAAALTLLHDVLSHRRHKTWSPSYESVMLLYLDLCLKKNKFREAKDGLHQYRNVSQSQAPGSLEIVIKYLMEKAELKCKTAKECAEEMATLTATSDSAVVGTEGATTTTDADDEDDFDDVTTHQSILLSTMSHDPEKTQRETAVVLPSLKFLWETYRAILDILRSNSKLEHLYHSAAIRALQFCKEYNRRMEFRRLCDMLRMHLGNLQKYGLVASTGAEDGGAATKMNSKVRGWEGWTMESIELHLQTRFIQLETATHLHLYTEGFRTVEEIYTILQISSSPSMMASLSKASKSGAAIVSPKAKLMATYYEKLTTLFWVSGNHLFHAFAWYKHYTLCREYNRGMNKEMKTTQASMVLLSALCIPEQVGTSKNSNFKSGTSNQSIYQMNEEETISREKMARMATLLGFHTKYPTREALLYEIKNKNMMEDMPSHIQQLYELLEDTKKKNNPLKLFENSRPLLKELLKSEDFAKYVKPLSNVLLLKLIVHLSSAYYTVSMPFLRKLTCSEISQDDGEQKKEEDDVLNPSFQDVERAIVLFAAQKNASVGSSQGGGKSFGYSSARAKPNFSVKIDHKNQCLRFIPNATSSQWEQGIMRYQLTTLAKSLSIPSFATDKNKSSSIIVDRATKYNSIRESLPTEHTNILERKNTIEKRKEEVERLAREKLRIEHARKVEEENKRRKEEASRLDRERKLREAERVAKIQKELEFQEKKKFLKALGKEVVDEKELEKVDTVALAKEHAMASNKKKEDAERKRNEKAKKLDYLVRATRIEEIPLVKKRVEDTLKNEKIQYEEDVLDKIKNAKTQWESDVSHKKVLSAHEIFSHLASFEDVVMARRESLHDAVREQVYKEAEVDAKAKKQQRAHRRRNEEQKRRAIEEKERLEAERLAREEEERRIREEEKEKKRQAEIQRMAEEREKKEREKEEEREKNAPPPSMSKDLDSGANGGDYVVPSRRRSAASNTGGSVSSRFANLSSDNPPSSSSRFSSSGNKGDRHAPGAGSRYDRVSDRESSSRFGDKSRPSSSRFSSDKERDPNRSSRVDRESSSRFSSGGERGGDRGGERGDRRESSSRLGDRNSSRFDRKDDNSDNRQTNKRWA